MRLLRTGASLRATRTIKLQRHRPISRRVEPFMTARQLSQSTAVLQSQSRSRQSSSVKQDKSKKSCLSELQEQYSSTPDSRFQEKLSSSPENEIIHDSNGNRSGVNILGQPIVFDEKSNLSSSILDLIGRRLYETPDHPLAITRRLIESAFPYPTYKNHIASNPVVTTKDNFDVLGFPADHPGRSRTDTYYVDSQHVLRTHTSAHQHTAFRYMRENQEPGYTICADVYRRDSIDRSHFPVFHQMEGARTWTLPEPERLHETRLERQDRRAEEIEKSIDELVTHDLEIVDDAGPYDLDNNPVQAQHDEDDVLLVGYHLKRSLELLVARVFTAAQTGRFEDTAKQAKQQSQEEGPPSDAPMDTAEQAKQQGQEKVPPSDAPMNTAEQAKQQGQEKVPPSDVPMDTAVPSDLKVRWIEAYFPFTSPSWELEVFWQGEWLEILGCGVVQQSILNDAGLRDRIGWAWGIGIERLAMLLFNIPDIRLFWSQDKRFLSQFKAGQITRYEPFSKYPECYKDVSFWISPSPAAASPIGAERSDTAGAAAAAGGDSTKASPGEAQPAAFHENDIMEAVRDVAGALVEDVRLVDEFVHPKTGRKSLCYRINYRSLERTLTNEETNEMHGKVVEKVKALGVELR